MSSVTEQSREVTPGCLFAALPGTKTDGREFVHEALQSGAAAVFTNRSLAGHSVPHCIVADARRAYGELCHALHFNPSRQLGMVGVTGTNGKTTTTWLVRALLERLARPCGLLGTIEYSDGLNSTAAQLTTPDARTLAGWLGSMVARRTRYAALELSSHALEQQRTAGLQLDVAVVTNVTHDHFDYHATPVAYISAKARIAEHLKPSGLLVVNVDDAGSRRVLESLSKPVQCLTFGIEQAADLQATLIDETLDGTQFKVQLRGESVTLRTLLIGQHNVENLLAAIAALTHLGISLQQIAELLPHCTGAPGRMQRVRSAQAVRVFVDYAHTPDALKRVIQTVRHLSFGRVLVVFGSGGDRDSSKRPLMGQAASSADIAIVTSDNPRTEDPESIARQILQGMTSTSCETYLELDRQRAIERALELAEPGDTVLIAGKGHEREQIVGRQRFAFDDVAVCAAALAHNSRLTTAGKIEQD